MGSDNAPREIGLIASSARLPTERAYGLATDSLRKSLVEIGQDVIVAAPCLGGSGLPTVDIPLNSPSWHLARQIEQKTFAASIGTWAARMVVARSLRAKVSAISPDRLWTRFPELALAAHTARKGVVLELHHVPRGVERRLTKAAIRLLGSRLALVGISDKIADALRQFVPRGQRVLVEPSGVGKDFFLPSRQWPLESGPIRLLYIGSFSSESEERGCKQFIKMIPLLHRRHVNCEVRIVGGQDHEVAALRAYRDGLGISGDRCRVELRVPSHAVPPLVEWADVLLANYPESIAHRHESPLKLIEYAASGRPIVASATSSVLGTLPTGAFAPYEEGSLTSLADAIEKIASSSDIRARLTSTASSWAMHREWTSRTSRILEAIA